tara:strand:- start:598 stop:1014 length:417 start_codon:yes stop_codon:yes gene_type:complete
MNNYIISLPHEVLNMIFFYLSSNIKVFLNKKYYKKYNNLILRLNEIKNYNSLIRDILRNDYIFIFKYKLECNIYFWVNLINYSYKNVIYSNFITFLLFYCEKHSSNKCKNLIYNKLNEIGLKKIILKNNKIKNNKWIK